MKFLGVDRLIHLGTYFNRYLYKIECVQLSDKFNIYTINYYYSVP